MPACLAGKAGETQNRVQLDRVRRHPGLSVVEVEEGDPGHARSRAESDVAPRNAHLATPVRRGVLVAVSLFSGEPANPPSQDFIVRNSGDAQQIEVGWWPGDHRYPHAAFYAYAYPSQEGFSEGTLSPANARWDETLGEFILDWDDVRASADPYEAALSFARSAVEHGCRVCGWNPGLAASMTGDPPPVT